MITLFIDSSRNNLFLALVKDNFVLSKKSVESHSKHSNFLMASIEEILKENKLVINNVNNIVVLNGPGSFTGIRVGVTVAKVLAWALNIKLYMLTTLEALKLHVSDDVVISVIKERNDYCYSGIFSKEETQLGYYKTNDLVFNFDKKNISIVSFENDTCALELKQKIEINNDVTFNQITSYDYLKIVNYAISKEAIDPHVALPVYIKKIDVEK